VECSVGDYAYAICSVRAATFLSLASTDGTRCRLFFNILHPPLNVPALGESTLLQHVGLRE
jgi:hypothetical protein